MYPKYQGQKGTESSLMQQDRRKGLVCIACMRWGCQLPAQANKCRICIRSKFGSRLPQQQWKRYQKGIAHIQWSLHKLEKILLHRACMFHRHNMHQMLVVSKPLSHSSYHLSSHAMLAAVFLARILPLHRQMEPCCHW